MLLKAIGQMLGSARRVLGKSRENAQRLLDNLWAVEKPLTNAQSHRHLLGMLKNPGNETFGINY
jgi:hypothetical protein